MIDVPNEAYELWNRYFSINILSYIIINFINIVVDISNKILVIFMMRTLAKLHYLALHHCYPNLSHKK